MLAQSFPRRRDSINLSALAALSTRQAASNLATVFKHIEMSPNQLFRMVIEIGFSSLTRTQLHFPEVRRLRDLYSNYSLNMVKFTLLNLPVHSQSQQLVK
jgi:hypothetical protein